MHGLVLFHLFKYSLNVLVAGEEPLNDPKHVAKPRCDESGTQV